MIFAACQQVWFAAGGNDFAGGVSGLFSGIFHFPAEAFEQDDKLISAQSGYGVGFTYTCRNAAGNFLQQKVADLVAECIVQSLEVIDVDEQQALLAAIAHAGCQGLPQAIEEQTAVGQAGQRVVEDEHPNFVLRGFGIGEITIYAEEAGNALDFDHGCRYQHPEDFAILLSKPGLDVPAERLLLDDFKQILALAPIDPYVQFHRRVVDQFIAFKAKQIEECRVDVDISAIAEDGDCDGIEAGLEDRAVAFFTGAQSLLRLDQLQLRGLGDRDIAHQGEDAGEALNFDHRNREQNPDKFSILPLESCFPVLKGQTKM